MALTLDSPLTALAGIGPKKAALFQKLGVSTVGGLLRHFPRAYQNRGEIRTLAEAGFCGEPCAMMLTVGSMPSSVRLKNRMVMTKFTAFDETGRCQVIFFNQAFLKDVFVLGATYRFWGRLVEKKGKWDLSSPQFEPYDGIHPLPDFLPVYPLGGGVSQKLLRTAVGLALEGLGDVEDPLPADLREKYGLGGFRQALETLHRPMNLEGLSEARRYFVFEELLLMSLAALRDRQESQNRPGLPLTLCDKDRQAFLSRLPYRLTGAQTRVMGEITADLASGFAMHRLLSGDVGSGKTVMAAYAAFVAAKNGYQCALMAPTEILARQHYNDLAPLFASLGISTALLVGSLTPSAKKKIHEAALRGEVSFVIGTHALLTQQMRFQKPVLMITDEQHRFGIRQRAMLAEKGRDLHVLVMSATPIPRTLALVLYGDLSLSTLDELPAGRQKVSTFLVNESYRARLTGFIRKQVEEGRQVYVVCPAIEELPDEEGETDGPLVDLSGHPIEKNKIKRALSFAEELAVCLPGLSVACLHGRMSGAEKEKVMSAFAAGKIGVLVSTTVIEVGVNVPNATLMVVENAERFGLSQLHQLRGRVGRGKYKSWCILVSDTDSEEALSRLRALCTTNDGYRIAEFDLAQRGPGDFLAGSGATRQHGAWKTSLASLCEDTGLLESAMKEAGELLTNDPALEQAGHRGLKQALCDFLAERAGEAS